MLENITFGIEIECILNEDMFGDTREFPKIARYIFKLSDGWRVKSDSSVYSDRNVARNNSDRDYHDKRQGYPCEIVSPPLTGYAGLAEIKRFMLFLQDNAYVNKTCGGHVHVGVNSLFGVKDEPPMRSYRDRNFMRTRRQPQNKISTNTMATFAQNITLMVAALEDGIFSYSGGIARGENSQYARKAKSVLRTLSEDKYTLARDDRYRAINVSAIRAHGTVEFRLFAGSVNPQMWVHNILLAVKIAIAARDNVKTPKFLNGITRKSFDSIMRFAYGDNTPALRQAIKPHEDCDTIKPNKKRH